MSQSRRLFLQGGLAVSAGLGLSAGGWKQALAATAEVGPSPYGAISVPRINTGFASQPGLRRD